MARKANKPKVLISSDQRAVRVPRKKIARLAEMVAHAEGFRLGQLDVAIVGGREITGVNRRYLSHDRPTDVISFDLSGDPGAAGQPGGRQTSGELAGGIVGQLIICGDVAAREAKARGIAAERELLLYLVHGLLHLMNYEDSTIRGAARMHAREEELLREFIVK